MLVQSSTSNMNISNNNKQGHADFAPVDPPATWSVCTLRRFRGLRSETFYTTAGTKTGASGSERPTPGAAPRPPWAADGINLATAVLGRRVAVDWAGAGSSIWDPAANEHDASVILESLVDIASFETSTFSSSPDFGVGWGPFGGPSPGVGAGTVFKGFVVRRNLDLDHGSDAVRTLYVVVPPTPGSGALPKEHVAAVLDVAEGCLAVQEVVIVMEKGRADLAPLLRAFTFIGFEVVDPRVVRHSPEVVLMGCEL
ncbi:hypothetical protein M427DRAFT_30471 [Gonapodya prolifera JEL478]|uniref:Ornithine decarboxylase antizyme n=1 Tax=Gonapodya prolifera (strain JEL478) TaxID=1344416 RepID=A0A139ALA6_GONPJ|nr:hypothetical protein M427DRAFT_30471 [Gonapodya prolifera JEL478]|eukprot:KXS17324.1 hypothetical protein M427DRAFT_30471 [Gonapodya prolifera JEL478]